MSTSDVQLVGSNNNRNLVYRFALAYAFLAVLVIVIGVVTYKVFTLPSLKNVVHKSDVGYQTTQLIQQACDYTIKNAATSGVVVRRCAPYKGEKGGAVQIKGNQAVVFLMAQTNVGTYEIMVLLQKGVWAISDFRTRQLSP